MHVVKVMHFTYIARKPSIAMNELPKTPEGALRALNYPCMELDYHPYRALSGFQVALELALLSVDIKKPPTGVL